MRNRLIAATAFLLAVAGTARADDRQLVEAFYATLLNAASAADLPQRVEKVLAAEWVTMGNNTGGGGRADFIKVIQGLGQAVPNLKWEVQEILRDGNRYVVRGRSTGTPSKPFLGVEPSGKSFDIMSIDIHTVDGGKIVRSYHIEDWAGAIRQLRAP